MIFVLAACVHTPPHAPFAGTWEKVLTHHTEFRGDEFCLAEQEALLVDRVALWSAPEPEPEQNWCRVSGEHARWFDVVGQDGAYLSARLTESGCCPDVVVERCVTWDLTARKEVSVADYDPEHATERLQEARTRAKALGEGWSIDATAFLVGKGHVTFCAARGAEVALVPVN